LATLLNSRTLPFTPERGHYGVLLLRHELVVRTCTLAVRFRRSRHHECLLGILAGV
jgi:hypothetical protein